MDVIRNPNVNSKLCQDCTTKSTKNSNFKAKKHFFETYMKRGDIFDNTVGHSASTESMTLLIFNSQEPQPMGEHITSCARKAKPLDRKGASLLARKRLERIGGRGAANGRGAWKTLPGMGEELSQKLEFEATVYHMIRLEIQRKFS